MPSKAISAFLFLSIIAAGRSARADEIRLKDGSKIIGTIVGFENDSFRVETSYGFALIRKDKVADINITATKKDAEPSAKSSAPAPLSSAPGIVPAVVKEPVAATNAAPSTNVLAPMRAPVSPVGAANSAAKADLAAPKMNVATDTVPAPPVAPPNPPPAPGPPPIRDEIQGNQYVNFTYGLKMYKPPSWDLIPAARKALPDAVAALGTSDQTTLLVIGREHAQDSLNAHAAATSKALSDVYENYRLISSRPVTVAGLPAVEQRARGTADGRDWSVITMTLYKDTDAYTMLGMTYANSDLIQVQENVIAKAVNSLTFVSK